MSRGLGRLLDLTAAERRDARQPMTDIEGVGNLAELAVADAVDAGCDLLLDDLAHREGETRVELRLVERAAGFARLQELQ